MPAGSPASVTKKHPHGRGEDIPQDVATYCRTETPPRAWGRPPSAVAMAGATGNTPTGVGKTAATGLRTGLSRKHPHGRGEDAVVFLMVFAVAETPPRAWGRPAVDTARTGPAGNTPTGVGKTDDQSAHKSAAAKHPHGRGEDASVVALALDGPETPPRAWGRLANEPTLNSDFRNTPTGVGKTARPSKSCRPARKHPHGRGEDKSWQFFTAGKPETPPRAWGRLTDTVYAAVITGNTPTGVGKTVALIRSLPQHWKHPHGRGEDTL